MLLYQDFMYGAIADRPAAGSKGRRYISTDTNIEYYDDGATWQAVSLASSQLIGNIPESQVTSLVADLAAKAPLASPALTGNPTAPTQSSGDNSTKIATTAYVQTQITASSPVASVAGRTGAIVLAESDVTSLVSDLAAKAPLASPALTGTPTAPTPSTADNSTKLATTAYVQAQGSPSKSDIQQQAYTYAADTGSANAYAVTLSPAPTIVAGSRIVFKAANANTGASTLAVNGGSATALKKNGSTALVSGDIAVGQIVEAAFDGTNYQIIGGPGVASGSASTVVAAAPYVSINGTKYVAATMFPAVLPDFTGYSYAQGATTNVTGTNGSVNVRNVSSSVIAHYLKTASSSIEAEFLLASNVTTGTGAVAYYQGGIELWDSTNNQLYALQAGTYSGESGEGNNNSPIIIFQKIAYNGSTFSGSIVNLMYGGSLTGPVFHFKMSVSGDTLTAQYSMDGGQTWEAMATQSVGTISKAGIMTFSNSSMTMLSLATA
jgi:hypothetical protein